MSLDDARRSYEHAQTIGAPAAKAKAAYVARLRKLARLRIDQKVERRKVRLPELEAALEDLIDRRYAAAFAIIDGKENSTNAIAAKIIIGAIFNAANGMTREVVTADLGDLTSALTALQPSLSGKIAADVAVLLKWGDDA